MYKISFRSICIVYSIRYKLYTCHRQNNVHITHTIVRARDSCLWVWFRPLLFVYSTMFNSTNSFFELLLLYRVWLVLSLSFFYVLLTHFFLSPTKYYTKHKSICSINFYMTWEHFSPMAFVTTIHCHVHHDINVNVTMARSIFPAKWKCSLFTCERMFGFFYCNCWCCCCWCYGCFLSHKYVLPHMKFHVILLSRWEWERERQKEQTSVRVLWNLCWSGCYL